MSLSIGPCLAALWAPVVSLLPFSGLLDLLSNIHWTCIKQYWLLQLNRMFFVTFFAGYVQLLYHPDNAQTALTFRPDIMELEENETFPEFVR